MNKSKKNLFGLRDDGDDIFSQISESFWEEKDNNDDPDFFADIDEGILAKKMGFKEKSSSSYNYLMALTDEEILNTLRTQEFWDAHGKNDTNSLIVFLCKHPDAGKSLRFLSSQTGNFLWGSGQMISLGRALEGMDETMRNATFKHLFHEQSTIDASHMLRELIDFDLVDEWNYQTSKPKGCYADHTCFMLFDYVFGMGKAADLFSGNLPTTVHGMWFMCEQMTKHGADLFVLDQQDFDHSIVSLAFLDEQARTFQGSQAWFLRAWEEVGNKGEYVFNICEETKTYGSVIEGLDGVLALMDDTDVALFVEKSMNNFHPFLGKRVGGLLQKGILKEEVLSNAKKKM